MDQMMASENAEIVFQLLVEDLNAISLGSKGKNKVGDVPDAEMAVQLFQDELRQSLSSLADHRMAQSIADAVQLDGPVLFGAFTCEDQVVRDHTIARHLSGQRTDMELDGAIRNEVDISDELLATMAALYATKPEYLTNYDFAGESSTVHDRRQKDSRSCIACFADKKFFEVAQAPCQHNYCQDCVRDLFTTALSDESLFPPRCCGQTIPLETVRIFVTSELAATFKNKTVEFETSNRTYCCIQTCSGFIPAEFIQNDIAKCQECRTTTCRICKHEAHTSDCIGDEALQQVLEVETANGWQRCHSCKQMIELDVGCNHITSVYSLPLYSYLTYFIVVAAAAPNFATSVGNDGKLVHVSSGMKIDL
jgi:hypothetical protein